MNLNDEKQFKALVEAVDTSRKKMAPFRAQRTELLSLFTADRYGDNDGEKETYVNLLALATSVYVRQLAVRAPVAQVTSPSRSLRPMAKNFELACQEVARETKLGETLRKMVTDALFSPMAVAKVGIQITGTEDVDGEVVDVMDPFVKKVSFDDYVRDMSARAADSPKFEGDQYTMSLEEALSLYPTIKGFNLGSGDDIGTENEDGEERAEHLAHDKVFGDDHYSKQVLLQDIWLIDERKMVTYMVKHPHKPLRIVDLDVDEEGPYRSLYFQEVPDNGMPLPPFSILRNIFELTNSLYRRMAYQAKKQKRVVGFADEDSALRFNKARDGDGVHWSSQKPEDIAAGGIDQTNLAFFLQSKDQFSWLAGNLDTMGGLSPMSETAKQEQLLSQTTNAQMADMQDATSAVAESIFRAIAFYEWTEPVRERMLQKPVPGGADVVLSVNWTPETRQADFLDFNFTISPQSMREDSPAAKSEKLLATLQQVILPLLPNLQSQGLQLDAQRLIELLSDYQNLPELEQLLVTSEGAIAAEQIAGNPEPAAAKPSHTHRTYERINRAGATRHGKDDVLSRIALGAGVQESEQLSLFNSTA